MSLYDIRARTAVPGARPDLPAVTRPATAEEIARSNLNFYNVHSHNARQEAFVNADRERRLGQANTQTYYGPNARQWHWAPDVQGMTSAFSAVDINPPPTAQFSAMNLGRGGRNKIYRQKRVNKSRRISNRRRKNKSIRRRKN
jgi:hypothetical protein